MKNISRHAGRLTLIQREKNSANGNPRFLLHVGGVAFYTAPDSSLGYSVMNHLGSDVTVTVGTYYGRPTLNSIEPTKMESDL